MIFNFRMLSHMVLAFALLIAYTKALVNIQVQVIDENQQNVSSNLVEFCTDSNRQFDNNRENLGHFSGFAEGDLPLLPDNLFLALCAPLDFDIINNGGVVPVFRAAIIQEWVELVPILDNAEVDAEDLFGALITLNNTADQIVVVNEELVDITGINDLTVDNLAERFDDTLIRNMAATAVSTIALPRAPGAFCVDDDQCAGARLQQRAATDISRRNCEFLGVRDENDQLIVPSCNDFVALFTLSWLLVFILASYVILILWAMYWTIPFVTEKLKGKKAGTGGGRGGQPELSPQDQVLINTLASQCAATENILLMATDFVKQAKGMQSVLSVEAKRESKIMIYVCEYFQVLASILVALTHDYLYNKTFVEGEQMNIDDATTRALQIEVLNYIRTRIQLAMNSDSMTDKSLIRLAEALAIMQKVTESLTFVGFTLDRQFEDSLGTLRTPKVQFTEDAFFLGGIWKQVNNTPGMEQYENSPVCITINGADTKGLQRVGASLYLNNVQKDCKNYSKSKLTTIETVGKSLSFSSVNSGERGEGSQDFIRSFWGAEISALQAESKQWVTNEGALEAWLDQQRLQREQAAQPVVTQSSRPEAGGKRRRRRRRNKEKDDETKDDRTEITEATEATEQSGWTVDPSNNFVYNVKSVAAHGLGIAGKPNIPFDKPNEKVIKEGSKVWRTVEYYFPNFAAAPKFYTFFFIIMPIIIIIPWMSKIGDGSQAVDIDGNVGFKARPAGFGTSYLGVPGYYFLDARVPEVGELVSLDDEEVDQRAQDELNAALPLPIDQYDPFGGGDGKIFVANVDAFEFFLNDWDGSSGRRPDEFLGELQGGILAQENADELATIRNMQKSLEVSTMFVYGLMHIGAYFFGMVPLTLIRESLEILARRFPIVRQVYPLSAWRELHMTMGLSGILFVVFGATVFLITQIVAIQRDTPFVGLGGDPNIPVFFNFTDNVLYIRQVLLPAVPLLLLMKYASRGPPRFVRLYFPRFISMNYWEICYFLHYFTALTAIIVLVIYRAQVFYWMGTTWGVVWGGNKIVRILRTRRTTIRKADLISYTVEDSRNNAKKRSDVLRITLNVPSSFPSSARGQACWITCPEIDIVAHPFTLAKTPDENEQTIMFHIAVKYMPGDDIIEAARPSEAPTKNEETAVVASDPNALPPGWKAAVDPASNQTYYYNSAQQRTTWTCPKETTGDRMAATVRGITSRFSANFVRGGSSALWKLDADLAADDAGNARNFVVRERATWTQKFAALARYLQNLEPHLRANTMKDHPIYVSAPLGTSMDNAIKPSVPGSMVITTQNGLPAAESCVRWLLMQPRKARPVFHFFVSVVREVNDAVAVLEMLREALAESVVKGFLNIDGVNGKHAHMMDWLSVHVNLTRRKASQIIGDRAMLMRSLNPPKAAIDDTRLAIIDEFIASRVMPGRLQFDRFLVRSQQMVMKRTGDNKLVVAYCGSGKVAQSLRAACRRMKNVHFDGEYI